MDMDMDMGGGSCKISMLWNWYTIDACFLASSWHVRSGGAFAASCIGVALLTVSLEALRRACREFDVHIQRQWRAHAVVQANLRATQQQQQRMPGGRSTPSLSSSSFVQDVEPFALPESITLRATFLQQIIRAVLHAVTFGVAYIIMLLAMYFNGFIIISIIIGAGLGKFFCDWMVVTLPLTPSNVCPASTRQQDGQTAAAAADQDAKTGGMIDEPTVCCG